MQKARQDFLVDKVINNQPDDDDGELDLNNKAHATIIISETDGDWEDMDAADIEGEGDGEAPKEMGDVPVDASSVEMTESKQSW